MPLRFLTPHIAAAALLASLPLAAHADKPRKPTPPLPAAQYASHDTHPNEHVTIAAFPADTKDTAPHTRLNYLDHGFLPIRIIVTNNSSQPLSLDDARILFISSDDYTENAATDEELQRRLFELKSVRGTHIPLPAPLPPLTIHHKPVDQKILADDHDFGFKTTTIPPHATVAGWLYYDVRDLNAPVLKGATVELREVRWSATNKSLDSFEISLQPTAVPPANH
jgi:hypothetical protein